MPDLVILVTTFDREASDSGQMTLIGICIVDGHPSQIGWSTEVSMGALASTINTATKDAAIAACAVAGFTVGALDKKTLFAGAVGL